MLRYSINPKSEIPVYRQLVDQINAQIRSGALETGTQLPTVREMAEQTGLSCGTIKRVYDRLREMGDIEMTRRRGSFVKYVNEDRDSRKVQAMTAIDRMIRSLSDLNFSPSEIQIFLNLKLREWGLRWSGIHLVLITDCEELAPLLERQLSSIPNARVNLCSLQRFREYPYSVDEEADVILTSAQDGEMLLPVLPDKSKMIRLAFAPSAESMLALGSSQGRLGAVCESEAFAALLRQYLPELEVLQLHQIDALDAFAKDCAVVIAPAMWREDELRACLGEKYLPFEYRIDAGSLLYLEERINRIRDERQLRPGNLGF